jgi:hypothetical protein
MKLNTLFFSSVMSLVACNLQSQPIKNMTGLQIAPPAAPTGIPIRSVNVLDYGAIPNDAKDDTKQIQAAIDGVSSQGGGSVLFPAGRFEVSIQATSSLRPHPQGLVLKSKLRLAPVDPSQTTVIRLVDNQGNYESMMATAEYPTPLEDLILEGLTIDGNGQNNVITRAEGSDPCCANSPDFGSGFNATPRYALRVYLGARILIQNMRFINQTNVNVITFNGQTMTDATIQNSSFEGVGNDGVDFDHSSIYTNGPRMSVVNNRFTSRRGAGTPGARTAIETHDVDQTVEGNTIDGFLAGINVVGGGSTGGERQAYRNNTITNVNTGFLIWSNLEGQPAGQNALRAVEISNNTIGLNNTDWLNAKLIGVETRVTGISIEGQSDAGINDLEIFKNTINFAPMQFLNPYRDQFSNGIQLWSYKAPNLPISQLRVSGNKIFNALGAAIRSDIAIVGDNNSIEGNAITNPVLTDKLNYPELEVRRLRSGIYVSNQSQNVAINNNSVILEAGAKSDLQFGISAISSCATNCSLENNTVSPNSISALSLAPNWTVK